MSHRTPTHNCATRLCFNQEEIYGNIEKDSYLSYKLATATYIRDKNTDVLELVVLIFKTDLIKF